MVELRTEEEQLEVLKSWWKNNGRSLLLGLALALVLVFGWKGWQQRQEAQAANASVLYQNLVDAVLAARAGSDAESQQASAVHFASTLKGEYANSGYAALAAMLMARVAVDAGDYETALTELGWVRDADVEADLKQVAVLRSARIRLAQGDAAAAQALLEGAAELPAFAAAFDELRGDILVQLGDLDQARSAYDRALDKAAQQARPILEMKRNDLAQGGQS